jgi:hypothetical protein
MNVEVVMSAFRSLLSSIACEHADCERQTTL